MTAVFGLSRRECSWYTFDRTLWKTSRPTGKYEVRKRVPTGRMNERLRKFGLQSAHDGPAEANFLLHMSANNIHMIRGNTELFCDRQYVG